MNNNPLGPWRQGRLGDEALTEINYGKANPKKEGNIPVIGSSGVYDSTDEPLVDAPSILIGRKGNAGSIQLIKEPCWPSDTTFYLKLKSKKLDYNFLSEYLTYRKLSSEKTQTTLPSLSIGDLRYLRIPIPPLVEQRGIVEVLGTVDECIRLTDAVIERAEELKRGLMQQLLTRGIGHTEYKETPLGEIPKTWKIVNLEDVAAEEKNAFVDGPFGSNLKVSDYTDIGVRIIRLNNIGEGKFVDSYKRYISETKFNDLLKHAIYPGDIIISEMADPIARACIVPNVEEKYILTAKSVRLNVNNKYNTNFMMYLINSPTVRNQAKSQTMGSTRPMITLSGLKKLKIPLPPILEQNKISNILCTLDNYFEIKNSEKKKYLDIKKGLMQILLSGKIRIGLKGDELHRIGDGREANN